jgi:hypothetical protein
MKKLLEIFLTYVAPVAIALLFFFALFFSK